MDAPRFAADERPWFDALDLLLGEPGPRAATAPPETVVGTPRPEVLHAGTRRIGIACVRFLCESGGVAARTVLRRERRHGRIWEPEMNRGFRLRFTQATADLWLNTARALSQLVRPVGRTEEADEDPLADRPGAAGRRAERRAAHAAYALVPTQDTETGDVVVYALAARSLPEWVRGEPVRAVLDARLRRGSPLALLASLSSLDVPAFPDRLRRLVARPVVRIAECVDDYLVGRWRAATEETLRTVEDATAFAARCDDMATVLEAWVRVLDEAGRLDLARAVLRFLIEVTTDLRRRADLRRSLTERLRFRNLAGRDAALRALARVLGVGEILRAHRQAMAGVRFGDARYAEAQVFLGDADAIAAPHWAALTFLTRTLRGEVA